jgi:hypothetical protein
MESSRHRFAAGGALYKACQFEGGIGLKLRDLDFVRCAGISAVPEKSTTIYCWLKSTLQSRFGNLGDASECSSGDGTRRMATPVTCPMISASAG